MKKTFLIVAAGLAAYGIASAQTPQDKTWLGEYLISKAELGTAEVTGDMAAQSAASKKVEKALKEAVGNRARTGMIAGYAATNKETVNSSETALALLQNQKLIEQNDQIISLLTKLVAKK